MKITRHMLAALLESAYTKFRPDGWLMIADTVIAFDNEAPSTVPRDQIAQLAKHMDSKPESLKAASEITRKVLGDQYDKLVGELKRTMENLIADTGRSDSELAAIAMKLMPMLGFEGHSNIVFLAALYELKKERQGEEVSS